jgi:hypothetical protein
VKGLLGGTRFVEVEPGASDFLVTPDGFFVKLPAGRSEGAVQAVGLCVDREYFLPSGFRPEAVSVELTFHGVKLSGSAARVLAGMEVAGIMPVDLMTDQELFTIVYGRSLVLEFLPDGAWPTEAEASRLAAVQFNFGPRYVGKVHAVLSPGSPR